MVTGVAEFAALRLDGACGQPLKKAVMFLQAALLHIEGPYGK
jgi:hypothetical protein